MNGTGERLRLLADETRIRILHLLAQEPLTVAELQELLHLGQSSVSGHLSKLKQAQLIHAVSEGASHRYRLRDDIPNELMNCWDSVQQLSEQDPEIQKDQENLNNFRKHRGANWADAVAGSLEHHYSPGRNWQSLCHSLLGFADFGICADIGAGDGSLLEILAPACQEMHCIDASQAMADACAETIQRLKLNHVHVHVSSAESLPLADASCNSAIMLQSLHYIPDPAQAINEAYRILQPGGKLLIATLSAHNYAEAERYGHRHFGFSSKQIKSWLKSWSEIRLHKLSPEDKPPHFQSLIISAQKPG